MSDPKDKDRIRALARRRLFGGQIQAPRVGRFVLTDHVGSGAMGVVYAAYDPQLDRKVALKLLYRPDRVASSEDGGLVTYDERAQDDDAKRERIVREARALARLSHPNVIAVHEVGMHEGTTFIAMEFVEGRTVTDWIASSQPTAAEIIDVYCQAGVGLAAAHDAGLVHRDFKPDNVMVAADGRTRVLDFGLARPLLRGSADSEHEPELAASPGPSASGVLAGTPRYLAPECWIGAPAGPRSDQFALCVSLYEGLSGEPPFDGDTIDTLKASVCGGRARELPASVAVGRWVRNAIRRGLAAEPDARWPSVAELVTALRHDPAATWRRGMLGAAFVMLGVGIGGLVWPGQGPKPCDGGPEKIAEVWGEEARTAAHAAFVNTGLPYAERAWETVAQRLDEYGEGWITGYEQACAATHVRGEQSRALLDSRMECLDQRRAAMRGLTEAFAEADGRVVERATDAVTALPPVEDCADTRSLREAVPPPGDPHVRAEVARLRADVAMAGAQADLGRVALASARALTHRADTLGYAPAQAEASLLSSEIAVLQHDYLDARSHAQTALLQAEAGRHRRAAAEAAAMLVLAAGFHDGEQGARSLHALAEAKIDGLGGDERLQLLAARNLGTVLAYDGFTEEAVTIFDGLLPRAEKQFGRGSLELASMAHAAGHALVSAEEFSGGIAQLSRALEIWQVSLGEDHPLLIDAHTQLGRAANGRLDPELALQHLEAARGIEERAGPIGHRRATLLHMRLGEAYGMVPGRFEDGLAELDHALDQAEAGNATYVLIAALTIKAGLLTKHGQLDAAEPLARRALVLAEQYYGSTPELAHALFTVATVELARDRFDQARGRFETVQALLAGRRADHPTRAHVLTGLGLCALGSGHADKALALLEDAVAIRGDHESWGSSRGWTSFGYARALVANDRDAGRARVLAEQARETFVRADEPVSVAAVERWLASLGSRARDSLDAR